MNVPPPIAAKSSHRWLIFAALGTLAILAVLFFFNPAGHGFYPRCFFKLSTGLDCAGCGGLRATHQLLNGNFRAAYALNPLLFFAMPVLAVLLANIVADIVNARRPFHAVVVRLLLWALLLVTIVFTVLRNVTN